MIYKIKFLFVFTYLPPVHWSVSNTNRRMWLKFWKIFFCISLWVIHLKKSRNRNHGGIWSSSSESWLLRRTFHSLINIVISVVLHSNFMFNVMTVVMIDDCIVWYFLSHWTDDWSKWTTKQIVHHQQVCSINKLKERFHWASSSD